MNRNSQSPGRHGFTLIEVALALGVAAVALVAIMGLVPIGLISNQDSIDRTAATTIAAAIAADLRATPFEIPPVVNNSPRFQIPLPPTDTAMHTLFLRDDGSAAGTTDEDADPNLDPRYRVTLFVTAPPAATQKGATTVRILVTWPALADRIASGTPVKYAGAYEVVTALNRQ